MALILLQLPFWLHHVQYCLLTSSIANIRIITYLFSSNLLLVYSRWQLFRQIVRWFECLMSDGCGSDGGDPALISADYWSRPPRPIGLVVVSRSGKQSRGEDGKHNNEATKRLISQFSVLVCLVYFINNVNNKHKYKKYRMLSNTTII